MNLALTVVLFGVFLCLDLILIAIRAAYQFSTQVRLLNLRETMEKKVNQVLALQVDGIRLRAGLSLGLVLTRFFLAGLGLEFLIYFSPDSPFLLRGLVVVLAAWVVFFFEWVIERSAASNPELWAIRLNSPARFILLVSLWATYLPLKTRGEAVKPDEAASTVTQDDFRTLVDASQEEGLLELEEGRMIISIVRLGETLAREVMVPRIDMIALDVTTPPEDAVEVMLQYGHSRVPVYEETVDQVLGLLYVKDLLRAYRTGFTEETLRNILRPAYYVPEAKHLDLLLAEMQSKRVHMAIVVDEYGGVAGLVTMEDIVEEIVGEIQDEYDQEEESPYVVLENGELIFQGRVDLSNFNEVMGSQLSDDEADTIGGFIYSQLGRVPSVGEKVLQDNLLLTVEHVSARRIRKVRAAWLSPDHTAQQEAKTQSGIVSSDTGEFHLTRSMHSPEESKPGELEDQNGENSG